MLGWPGVVLGRHWRIGDHSRDEMLGCVFIFVHRECLTMRGEGVGTPGSCQNGPEW